MYEVTPFKHGFIIPHVGFRPRVVGPTGHTLVQIQVLVKIIGMERRGPRSFHHVSK
jgi:hypothetical protein